MKKICLYTGLLCIAAALILVEYNLYTDSSAGMASEAALAELTEQISDTPVTMPTMEEIMNNPQRVEYPDYVLSPMFEMPTVEIDGRKYIGELEIPAIDLELPIQSEFDAVEMQKAPCRYTGSVYSDDMVLTAHNYSYHFGKLKELKLGDEVKFTDVDGNVFLYRVKELETLYNNEYDYMTKGDSWDLTLFTCTLGGGARVTVRCEKEKTEDAAETYIRNK